MTIDEAITRYEGMAESSEQSAMYMKDTYGEHVLGYKIYCENVREYRQLVEWLRDYKRLLANNSPILTLKDVLEDCLEIIDKRMERRPECIEGTERR